MADETDVETPGGASDTSLEGALLQAAADLTEAVAALRSDAERLWGRTEDPGADREGEASP